jgi:hypothetical protein
MTDHNGVLVMQRLLLAGTLGLAMARKAAAILEDVSASGLPLPDGPEPQSLRLPDGPEPQSLRLPDGTEPQSPRLPDGTEPDGSQLREGAVLRAILDAANECLGHFDDRPPGERWCDALYHLLDLAAFAGDLGSMA